MTLSSRVALASVLLGAGAIVGRVSDLVATLVIARILMPADFGLVALAVTGLQFASLATELPLSQALIQRKTLDRAAVDTAFTLSLIRGAVVALVLYAVGLSLAAGLGDERLVAIAAVLAIAPIAAGLRSPMLVELQREVRYAPTALVMIGGKVAAFAISIALAFATGSYWAIVALRVAAPAVETLLTYVVAPYRPRLSLACVRELVGFVGWLSLSNLVLAANLQADRLLVGATLSRAQFGNYAMGSDIASTASYALVGPLSQTLFSGLAAIANAAEADARDRLRAAYLRGQQTLVAVMLPVGVGLAAVAGPFVAVVFTPAWAPVVFVLQWLAPVIGLQMLTVAVHAVALATGRTRAVLVRELWQLAVRLPPVLAAAILFGFAGAIVARALTGLVVILINLSIGARLADTTILAQLRNCWRSLASALLMAGVLAGVQASAGIAADGWGPAALAGLVALGGVTYGGAHALLWLACGRPEGVEAFALGAARAAVRRFAR